jgi:Zn-dependent membrane protease YugP
MLNALPIGYYIDPYFFYLIVPALLLSLFSQLYVKSTFARYDQVSSASGITAEQAARRMLDAYGCSDISIVTVAGGLTDRYDPRTGTLGLSQSTFGSTSVAALGVAAHETGHAVQHANGYLPNRIRAALVPVAGIGSSAGPFLAFFGIMLSIPLLTQIGILLFSAAVLFYVVTLPVEFNASRRALEMLGGTGMLDAGELKGARRVLHAAAMTYVASTLVAFAGLLRLVLLSRGNRRR